MNNKDKICVVGSKGLLGSAVVDRLYNLGYSNIILCDRKEVDLRDQKATREFFELSRPDVVFFLAAVAAGINYKKTHPVEMLLQNLQMVSNVLEASYNCGCKQLLNICSALVYPRSAQIPLKEEDLVSVDTNNLDTPYALSKAAGIKLTQYYREEYDVNYVSAVPCNFFGKYAPFQGDKAGVVPSLISRIYEAKINKIPQVEVWGTGNACRELLNSKDVASACIFLMQENVEFDFVNIGCGREYSIREIAETIKRIVGYEGKLFFNADKPEGRQHMQLNIDRLKSLGWKPSMNLEESILDAFNWYVNNQSKEV